MSLSSKKQNAENSHGLSSNGRLPVRIMDDNQWLFVSKSFRMSPRELVVAKFVCGGLSNEEIATRLGIKTATIKTHLRNIYRRIRVQRKLDMLLAFIDQSAKYSNARSDVPIKAVSVPTEREIDNDNIAGH